MSKLNNLLHNRILDLRIIQRMLDNIDSDDPKLIDAIEKADIKAVNEWLKEKESLEDKTVIELRSIAKRLRVPNYQSLSKHNLILNIDDNLRTTQRDEKVVFVG